MRVCLALPAVNTTAAWTIINGDGRTKDGDAAVDCHSFWALSIVEKKSRLFFFLAGRVNAPHPPSVEALTISSQHSDPGVPLVVIFRTKDPQGTRA